jgi:endonuclease YncB( thermonuclease family)
LRGRLRAKERDSVKTRYKVLGLLAVLWVVGSCMNAMSGNSSDGGSTSGTAQAVSAVPAAKDYCAYSSLGPYEPDSQCRIGGEVVTVRHVVNGDTFDLTDGRTVGLLGVDAPQPEDCSGPGATKYLRSLIEGQDVKLLEEPGVGQDEHGRWLRYVQTAGHVDERRGLPVFSDDVGHTMVLAGWALPYGDAANFDYAERIESAKGIAEYRPEGIYADPCGKPKVYGDDDGNGVADWEDDVDIDVDGDIPDLPDGTLTGGFCARKWWC